jgi:hypothetical protein
MNHLFSVAEHLKALAIGREEDQFITLQLSYDDVVALTQIIQDATSWILEKGRREPDWDEEALIDTIISARAFMEQELGCGDNG